MAIGTTWDLPNYSGELFTASKLKTPILSMIGGMGGGKQTSNFEFPISSEYTLPAAKQPAVTETASLTAPTPTQVVRGQNTNVTQIFHESIDISYEKMSNMGRLSGLNTVESTNNVVDEKAFQIDKKLKIIARDMEYCIVNGVYQKATDAATANKTRGLLSAITSNTTDAVAADPTKAMINTALGQAWSNGASMENFILFVTPTQKVQLSDLYAIAPRDRDIGGYNITQIETDFGNIGIMLHQNVPAKTILGVEMGALNAVFQPVPKKGNFFYEELSKTGASEKGQIYGKFGLDHGPEWMHLKITNLKS